MLDHRLFADRKKAPATFWEEVSGCCVPMEGAERNGEFGSIKKREIMFLDTRDRTIRQNGFVFRQRIDVEREKTEYTLKCRSPDRYVAAGANVDAGDGVKAKRKLEEDIGSPFVSRYSHSSTVAGPKEAPRTLNAAAKLFRSLGALRHDGESCSGKVKLFPTTSIRIFERVLTGPVLVFGKVEAEFALILWSDGPDGRPLVAESSFRYEDDDSVETARFAMQFFLAMQRLDWCLPRARTKTQHAYGDVAQHGSFA
jgi:hypothetical protein